MVKCRCSRLILAKLSLAPSSNGLGQHSFKVQIGVRFPVGSHIPLVSGRPRGYTIISQQANDFLNQEYGRAIASQSSLRILMKQDTTTIKRVVQEFNLSEYEEKFLLTCDRGEALIIADQNHVALKVVASEKEHPMLTTDPKEIYL